MLSSPLTQPLAPFDGKAISAAARGFLAQPHHLLIDGKWVEGPDRIVTCDPATGLPLAEVHAGGAAQIDAAVSAARAAFESGWKSASPAQRSACLNRLAQLMRRDAAVLGELDILDNGMPAWLAGYTAEGGADLFEYYAGWPIRIEGVTTPPPPLPGAPEALTYTLREPLGVIGQIIPWNVPLSMACMKLAPALAAGCTVVLKPAEETPLSALWLGELIREAGFPPGVVNIVNGIGDVAGAALVSHPDVDKIAFTGSTQVGKHIIREAAADLKKVSLELGGKSPVIVFPDADLDLAVPALAMAAFFLQGQNCMAGTRVFLHEDRHDDILARLIAYTRTMTIGHGLDPASQLGPLISREHRKRVADYVASGIAQGATLACGGKALEGPGAFFQPTIFTHCHPDMRIVREEIFGPVMTIQTFDDGDLDAIAAQANQSDYGLSGSVWTRDLATAHKMVARIRSGHVSINCHSAVGPNIPFGGYKQSGWGREFGKEGLDLYLETKAVTVRL